MLLLPVGGLLPPTELSSALEPILEPRRERGRATDGREEANDPPEAGEKSDWKAPVLKTGWMASAICRACGSVREGGEKCPGELVASPLPPGRGGGNGASGGEMGSLPPGAGGRVGNRGGKTDGRLNEGNEVDPSGGS